ncbi:hydroxyproline-rich glycoprotein family protein [Artemisia annua]|uniref:Hydroxyproline-rich glycoprotein family protein n=1 Tax=Artemisia annua TaxID=35608 RepID=A0A2U1QH12_ARTAN|nr:hydroxyproline-rich glycoprotein family protein [Artemisia annua]
MDREWGSKPGSGGAASAQNEAIDRRERLRRLALETIDLAKDPYFMRNHLGSYECKLCLTLHNNEGNYLAHTQGKRHQTNLAKRAAREAKDAPAQPQPHKRKVSLRKSGINYSLTFKITVSVLFCCHTCYECKLCLTLHNNEGNYLAHTQGKRHQTNLAKRAAREAKDAPAQPQPHKRKVSLRKSVKIGRPGYRVTKQFDHETKQRSLLFQIEYPEIEDLTKPRHRFMSSFEQRVESFDKRYQYLLFAAEPYETIGFKVPSTEIDKSTPKFFSHWDPDSKMFTPHTLFCHDGFELVTCSTSVDVAKWVGWVVVDVFGFVLSFCCALVLGPVQVKIGRPGYRVTKQFDHETKQRSLLFQIEYPEIEDLTKPRHRFMSSFEQRVESFDKRYQYLLFAAEPYETIGFKVPSTEIDKSTPKFFSHWDPDSKMFTLQLYFKVKPPETNKPPSAATTNGTLAPGVPPPPPQQQAPPPPPPASQGPPRGTLPPPPPPMGNGPRPMPPGGNLSAPPPPVGGGMTNFTPRPPMPPPPQGFPGQQMQNRPPPPPPHPIRKDIWPKFAIIRLPIHVVGNPKAKHRRYELEEDRSSKLMEPKVVELIQNKFTLDIHERCVRMQMVLFQISLRSQLSRTLLILTLKTAYQPTETTISSLQPTIYLMLLLKISYLTVKVNLYNMVIGVVIPQIEIFLVSKTSDFMSILKVTFLRKIIDIMWYHATMNMKGYVIYLLTPWAAVWYQIAVNNALFMWNLQKDIVEIWAGLTGEIQALITPSEYNFIFHNYILLSN